MCRLESHALFRAAHTVLLYSSLPDEVDTHTFIRRWEGRKRILLPVVVSDSELELRVYTGSGNMRRGAFNIDEPAGAAFTDYGSIDLAVIPGVAFDRHGNRRGGAATTTACLQGSAGRVSPQSACASISRNSTPYRPKPTT